MSIHNEFFELLESASFSSIDDQNRQRECFCRIRNWMNANTPSRLFRYRATIEEGFDINDVRGSSILNFNDPFESLPFADSLMVLKNLKKSLGFEARLSMWKALRDGCFNHVLKHIITEDDFLNMKETNGNTSFDVYNNQVCDSIARFLDGVDLLQLVSQYMRMLRCLGSLRLVACFSETNTSSLMWGHYADSHKGYCLEYDFKRAFAEDDELGTRFSFFDVNGAFIAPVVYSDKRFDATNSFLAFAQREFFRLNGYVQTSFLYPDMLEAFKTMIIKSKDWEYEREWRLATEIPDSDTPPAHGRIARIKPTALYIGAYASEVLSGYLFSLCQRKSIPCFKMVEDVYHGDFSLIAIPYEEYVGYVGKSIGM